MFRTVSRPLGLSLFLVNLLAFAVTPSIAQAASRQCATGTIVSSPSPGKVGNHLSSVVSLSATDAWAVGGASTPVGNPPMLQSKPLVVHWNGSAWRAVHAPLAGEGALSGIAAVSASDLWAVGHQGAPDAGAGGTGTCAGHGGGCASKGPRTDGHPFHRPRAVPGAR